MELIQTFIDLFLHLDQHLTWVFENYGLWTYLILFLIIFCETGLVVTPFLPGDSLLFGVGALAAGSSLNVGWLFILLSIAAIVGDAVNYWIGYKIGSKLLQREDSRFIKKEYIDRTHRFYEKYGGKTIIFARFVPIIRTFAPFVAGIGRMSYGHFAAYNVVGGLVWISSFLFAGYFFGNIPVVKKNFTLVILGIIVVSILPGVIELVRARRARAV
ncbi:MAG: DedA family protein [Candidatus Manganitrophus sp.]|nr:DedA family protein [Candidatus Manganitrophus sp.]WDT69913.1 MAG: DedA family protein [Candidatus Manganitrophus sp.]WDT73871.1 MAG: DedA family protein [Candidatus Manganitrophus sp.]WDT78448.1 MAG: DedA family protein [Candidatus Manganitrophus sp.]